MASLPCLEAGAGFWLEALVLLGVASSGSRLGWAPSQPGLKVPREQRWKLQGLLKPIIEVVLPHFHHILLVKASYKAGPNLKNGEIDSTSC